MKHFYFFLCVLFSVVAQAHQSTFLHFEDKNGQKDSIEIVVGLTDEEAAAVPAFSVDEAEQAMKDSTRWVWLEKFITLSDIEYGQTYIYKPYNGSFFNKRSYILFPADRLPVTVSWDKQFFIDNDLTTSVMSDMISWFDAVCYDEVIMWLANSEVCVFTNEAREHGELCTFEYFGKEEFLVKVVGLAIGSSNNKETIEIVGDNTPSATKFLRDGRVLIERNGHTYTLTGTEVR